MHLTRCEPFLTNMRSYSIARVTFPWSWHWIHCPSPFRGAFSNSCPLSGLCHQTISCAVIPVSSCLHTSPASVFSSELFFVSAGQSIQASATALPMNIQSWFPLGLTDVISLQSKGFWSIFSSTTVHSFSYSVLSRLYGSILTPIHDYWKKT